MAEIFDRSRWEYQGKHYALKNDQYRRARGGRAVLFDIFCSSCKRPLLVYQKDGPGRLLRCYLNRIFDPPELAQLQLSRQIQEPRDLHALRCPGCSQLIGMPSRYLDGRLAYVLQPGAYMKNRHK